MNKMKKFFSIILMAAAAGSASSCVYIRINPGEFDGLKSDFVVGSSNMESRTYTVPQFTGIDSTIPADIDYSMTEGEPTVTVNAPDNLLGQLNFQVVDGILKVCFDDGDKRVNLGSNGIKVKVSSATLESLAIRGAGDFDAVSGIDCSSFEVNISGAGDVTLNDVRCEEGLAVLVYGAGDIDVNGLTAKTVRVDVNGAGDVVLSGACGSADLSIKGAGDIDARRLDCPSITSNVSGMGSIKRK